MDDAADLLERRIGGQVERCHRRLERAPALGPATTLEQAMLAAEDAGTSAVYGQYNAVGAAAGALGALAVTIPGVSPRGGVHGWLFAVLVPVGLAGVVIAWRLSPAVEAPAAETLPAGQAVRGWSRLGPSRPVVRRLSGLFAVDAAAGGLVTTGFLSYYLASRYHVPVGRLGWLFFAVSVVQAISVALAPRLARRFGLVATMVGTHLPSNVLLAAVAFAPSFGVAAALPRAPARVFRGRDRRHGLLAVDGVRGAGQGRAMDGVPLDALVTRMLSMSPFDYRVAVGDSEREVAYRLRGSAVLDRGWCGTDDVAAGMERDEYDDRAVQVLGWDGDVAMSTGRVVLPPELPTEKACGIVVEPRGEVVDVGRMCVARSHQSLEHAAFIGLMCRLYLVMREHGFGVACGMMSAPARRLVGYLGLRLEILGPERTYWNESRAPVRFSLMSGADPLADASGQPARPQAARTSAVFAPPKPNELDNA